jgi:hypothetical protein
VIFDWHAANSSSFVAVFAFSSLRKSVTIAAWPISPDSVTCIVSLALFPGITFAAFSAIPNPLSFRSGAFEKNGLRYLWTSLPRPLRQATSTRP